MKISFYMFSLYQAFILVCFSLLGGMYIVADSLWIGYTDKIVMSCV